MVSVTNRLVDYVGSSATMNGAKKSTRLLILARCETTENAFLRSQKLAHLREFKWHSLSNEGSGSIPKRFDDDRAIRGPSGRF